MGLRFRRSLRVAPGVRLNLGTRGGSLTVGKRGASINIGRRGTFVNAGIPGTGLNYRERLNPTVSAAGNSRSAAGLILTVAIILILGYALLY